MKVRDYLSDDEILCQLAEDAAGLSQAALTLRRALTGKNPTPKTVCQCRTALWEKILDVALAINTLDGDVYLQVESPKLWYNLVDNTQKTYYDKLVTWVQRLEAKRLTDVKECERTNE